MGLSRVVVCDYGLWVLWVLGSGCWVLVLLVLVLKLDGLKTHNLRKTAAGLESTTHHHMDGCNLARGSDKDVMWYDIVSTTDGSTTAMSVLEPQQHQTTAWSSVATAIADIFRNNGISMGRNLAKILKILEKIDDAKS